MILDAVLRKEGLFEPEQLIDGLKGLNHKVSRATVYRTLSHLQDAGILKQIFFDNKQSYYEVIAGRQAYDYLICVATGRVVEFSSDKLRKLRDEICREHGFDPISHQFHVFGLSPEGKAAAEKDGSESGSSTVEGDAAMPMTSPFAPTAPGGGRSISTGRRKSPR